MSLGFINREHSSRTGVVQVLPQSESILENKHLRYDFIVILCLQSAFDLFVFGWCGLVLKWALTFGDVGHTHPHIPEEEYIQDPNNMISVIMIAHIFDFVEPFLLLGIYLSNVFCASTEQKSIIRRLFLSFCLFYSGICTILIGASVGSTVGVGLTQYPAVFPPPPPMSPMPVAPPSAPGIHYPLYPDTDVIVLYITVFVVVVIKLVSNFKSIPREILIK